MSAYVTEAQLEAIGTIIGNRIKAHLNSAWIEGEELVGLKNGNNPNFTFVNAPANGKAAIFHNGLRLRRAQYSIIGVDLTLTFNPLADDSLTSDYFK
jgi:hypothetical protein